MPTSGNIVVVPCKRTQHAFAWGFIKGLSPGYIIGSRAQVPFLHFHLWFGFKVNMTFDLLGLRLGLGYCSKFLKCSKFVS